MSEQQPVENVPVTIGNAGQVFPALGIGRVVGGEREKPKQNCDQGACNRTVTKEPVELAWWRLGH